MVAILCNIEVSRNDFNQGLNAKNCHDKNNTNCNAIITTINTKFVVLMKLYEHILSALERFGSCHCYACDGDGKLQGKRKRIFYIIKIQIIHSVWMIQNKSNIVLLLVRETKIKQPKNMYTRKTKQT